MAFRIRAQEIRSSANKAGLFLFFVLTIGLLEGQYTDLVAPGNGADLYYALTIRRPVPDGFSNAPSPGPIYRIGSVPAMLFVGFAPPVFPPDNRPSGFSFTYYMSPYYLTSHPQISKDGSVVAFTGERVCLGGCLGVPLFQTTVQGVPGKNTLTFDGKGWLSSNGRYLLTGPSSQMGVPGLTGNYGEIDLQTGNQQALSTFPDPRLLGRVVADEGTAVVAGGIFRAGKLTQLPISEGVIDAAGGVVLYTAMPSGSAARVLRIYRLAGNQDDLFLQANGDTYAPTISADGQRALFLSTAQFGIGNPPGAPQLYAINIDGTGFRELTSAIEPLGVQQYTMSDDGQVAWYVSGNGNFVKLDLHSDPAGRVVFHVPAVDLTSTVVSGSAVTLNGAGLTDADYYGASQMPLPTELGGLQVTLDGAPTPLISVSPSRIVFQAPWEIQAAQSVVLQVITKAHTPDESRVQAIVMPSSSAPALLPLAECTVPFCYEDLGGGAIHQDWSGYVTHAKPALPGEILYFYGTGFGPVQPTVPTGTPAPASPPASATTPLSCNASVLYTGLAPGLIGYYQITIQLPAVIHGTDPNPRFQLDCGTNVFASIPVQPNAP